MTAKAHMDRYNTHTHVYIYICNILYYTMLYYTVLYYTILYDTYGTPIGLPTAQPSVASPGSREDTGRSSRRPGWSWRSPHMATQLQPAIPGV